MPSPSATGNSSSRAIAPFDLGVRTVRVPAHEMYISAGSVMGFGGRNERVEWMLYRDEIYSLQILLSRTKAGPGRTVKQEREEISSNHVQRVNLISVVSVEKTFTNRPEK